MTLFSEGGRNMKEFAIETERVSKRYGEQLAVDSVDIHMEKGKIYGLLGRNGAGKTTLMKMMLGLTGISAGAIRIFGEDIRGREKEIYPRIGSLIETPGFYPNLTGTENLEIFAMLRGTPFPNAVERALRVVGLPFRDKKLFGNYSLGMKQRLGIANAILHDPEILILDEPTNGLDPIGIAEVREFLREWSVKQGKTILISSHILSEITLVADTVGILDRGVLLEESGLKELRRKNRSAVEILVSDVSKTATVLERHFGIMNYAVEDAERIKIYELSIDTAELNRILVLEGISVKSCQICKDSLEDYFKKLTGGEGIA